MRPRLPVLVFFGCLAAGAVCAHAQDVETLTPGGGPGAKGGGLRGLFVSPCGKPFRAGLGEPYPVAAWFAEADANHDGALDRHEFEADALAFFRVLDANHDQVIDGAEVSDYEHRMLPEVAGMRPQASDGHIVLVQMGGGGMGGSGGMGGMGGGGGHGHHHRADGDQGPRSQGGLSVSGLGAAPFGLLGEPEPVTAADADFNGRITPAEFAAAAQRRFGVLDADGDHRITLAELPKTAVQTMGDKAVGQGRGRARRGNGLSG